METTICKECGDYGWDMINGVCSDCRSMHKQALKVEQLVQPKCAYCGKPATDEFEVWENGRRIKKIGRAHV